MRKIGTPTSLYFGLGDAYEGFVKMKSHGFDSADYQNLVNTENELFTLSDSEFEKRLLSHKNAAKEAGVVINQTHGPWRSPKDATVEDRAERLEKMTKTLWATSVLGSKYMAIHPIMPYGCGANPEPERFMELNLSFFEKLTAEAKKCGVIICFENMPFPALTLSSTKQIADFVRTINSDNFKMCLDTGHCAVMKESPADALRNFGDIIKIMHVHDNDGNHDSHKFPFDGVIDWEDFGKALSDVDEDVVLSLETSASRSADDLEEIQKDLCYRAKKLII
ncbi:MAG: sugar phosphate isomerase/epimerase [Clostridia bacterium]|nr:sugar phosphate isomerase/epimerase [Clostridia bacterium]